MLLRTLPEPGRRSPSRPRRLVAALAAAGLAAAFLLPGEAHAQATGGTSGGTAAASQQGTQEQAGQAGKQGGGETATRRQQAAVKRLDDSVAVVQTMSAEPGIAKLLEQARGIYIVPTYARAALGVGGVGGSGVLMLRRADGSWGNPAFFNIGGFNVGLQAGAEGGALALVLLNQKAVDHFRNRNNFSFSADAGITVVNYARMAQGSTTGDVVAWSGGKGLFGNAATIGVNNIRYNKRLTDAYYGRPMTALQAIDSTESQPRADALRKALGASAPAGAK